MQLAAAWLGAADPGGQGVQQGAPAAPSVEVPGEQAEQEGEPGVEVWPAVHSLQLVAAAPEYLPNVVKGPY